MVYLLVHLLQHPSPLLLPSAGGEETENRPRRSNIPLLRHTAHKNRAVTSQDYEAIVRKIYPATSDIIIFGGEDQVPPEYGKVFIALKPKDS